MVTQCGEMRAASGGSGVLLQAVDAGPELDDGLFDDVGNGSYRVDAAGNLTGEGNGRFEVAAEVQLAGVAELGEGHIVLALEQGGALGAQCAQPGP